MNTNKLKMLALAGLVISGAAQAEAMNDAINVLRASGAVIVDPADIPSIVDPTPANNFLTFGVCSGLANAKGSDTNCSVVLKYGMKRDFNAYLQSLGASAPVKSLTELRQYNLANRPRNAIKYDQAQLDISDEMSVEGDRARYQQDRLRDVFLAGTHGIDEVMATQRLDALLFPGSSGANLAARPGYPTVIVPFGAMSNSSNPSNSSPPLGVAFTGTSRSSIESISTKIVAKKRKIPKTNN